MENGKERKIKIKRRNEDGRNGEKERQKERKEKKRVE